MPENGDLNESQDRREKGCFCTLKMEFPGFPDFGLCRGSGGSQTQSGFNGGLERDFWKDRFAFFEACECPIPKRRKLHTKPLFLQANTLPTLQKTFVDFFFVFAWEFCIEKWRGFLVNFSGLRFPRNKARKLLINFGEIRSKIRGKIRDGNSKNSGETFVLQLF